MITADGLQVGSCFDNVANIPHQIHNRRRDPALIFEFVKFDAQPVTVDRPFADFARITNSQVSSMKIRNSRTSSGNAPVY
ncbi:MAG: hypothetical protein IPJ46_01175 [Anaerolineales bacterium]|nr:hypothetical protein [Anaerolineales bacterium]